MPNTHFVYGNLLAGSSAGMMEEADLEGLLAAGVDTFVCLQMDYDEYGCEDYRQALRKLSAAKKLAHELRFVHCPMPDFGVVSDESLWALVVQLQRELRNGHTLYVHCFGGHGRTGTVVTNLIMAVDGVDFPTAMEKLQECHKGRHSKRGRQCSSCALSSGHLEGRVQKEQTVKMQAAMARQHAMHSHLLQVLAQRLGFDAEQVQSVLAESGGDVGLAVAALRQVLGGRGDAS